MNNDDNKQTKDQSTQHDNLSEHECSAEHNTQQSSEGDTNSHFQTEHATNTDETHSTANNTANNNANEHQRSETVKNWHNKNAIKRGIAMLGYGFIAGFVRLGITIIAVFQFFSMLFSEQPNQPLVKFGQNLNIYQYQINQFLTVNSEVYPFPFADWPNSEPETFVSSEYAPKA